MKQIGREEYRKMVGLYANFNIEITDEEKRQLKLFFIRRLQKIKLWTSYMKNNSFHPRGV
jgi:hypothetical protein